MSPEDQTLIAAGLAASLMVPYGLIRVWNFIQRMLTGAL